MEIVETNIKDLILLEPKVFSDDRGFFMESYNQALFEKVIGRSVNFVQDNHSKSVYGVLRGMHFQIPPFSQGKLVRCVVGEVYDVAVDLRKNSSTFMQYFGTILSDENKRQLWIPEGFAHGFLVLSNTAEFLYKTTNYYSPESERCLLWNDSEININWPNIGDVIISDKDKNGQCLSDLRNESFFDH